MTEAILESQGYQEKREKEVFLDLWVNLAPRVLRAEMAYLGRQVEQEFLEIKVNVFDTLLEQ